MEQCVKNYWLEEFYYWTQEQGGYTADMMGEILKTKADTMAINVILNSFNTIYNDVDPLSPSHAGEAARACARASSRASASCIPRASSR